MEKRHSLLKRVYRHRQHYLLLLLPVTAVIIFHYIPIYGIQIAFKNYKASLGIWDSEWVGFKHFLTFMSHPYFKKIMRNTIVISLVSFCNFPFPIIFALMLNEMKHAKLKKVCQMLTYAPHFMSTVVVCSMITLFLNRDGIINNILAFLGGERHDFMTISSAFPFIYSISGLWQSLGWGTIIYLAALSGISPELVDAAHIDGAGRFRTIWHIYLSHLKPTIVTMLILNLGSLLGVGFEKVFLLQNSLNMETSTVISTYVYEVGIGMSQFDYSAAIGLFNTVINFILLMLANAVSKRVAQIALW